MVLLQQKPKVGLFLLDPIDVNGPYNQWSPAVAAGVVALVQ